MQVFLKCECGSCPDWALIELQGELQQLNLHQKLQGMLLGELCGNPSGTFSFTIGNHILEGKAVKLPKPLAVIKKQRDPGDQVHAASTNDTYYNVLGVVRWKLLFKTRPRSIITKPEEQAKRQRVAS